MPFLKNFFFIFLLLVSLDTTKAMEKSEPQKGQALPFYAKYLSYTPREQFEYMMTDAMDVLGDQILHESGVSTLNIIKTPFNDLIPEDFIPADLEDKDQREAFKVIISHYAYLHQVRRILSAALSQEVTIIGKEITPNNWKKQQQQAPLLYQKWVSSYYCVTPPEREVDNSTNNDKEQDDNLKNSGCLLFNIKIDWLNCSKYLYLDKLPENEDINEIPIADSFSLYDINIAYQFLSSYGKFPFPGTYISDIADIISAGVELKSALDVMLGTKYSHSNPPDNSHYLDYDKSRLTVLKKEIELFQSNSLEVTFKNNQFIDWSEILKIYSIFRNAKCEALEYMISREEEGTSNKTNDLQQQAMKRDTVLLTLKKASELFSLAFSDGEQGRIRYIQKRFFISGDVVR